MSRFGLPKKERLLKSGGISCVYKNGRKLRYKDLSAALIKNSLGINRVGFIAPKAKIGLSSTRNRTKRLLREAFRLNKHKAKTGFDIIVYANRPIKCFADAEDALLYFFKAANLLSGSQENRLRR